MPNYTPTTDTFHATIPNCSDGDAAVAIVFNQGGNAAADNAAYLNAKLSALYAGGTLTPADTLTIADSETGHATRIQNLVVEEGEHIDGDSQIDGELTVDGDINNAVTTPWRDGGSLSPSALLKLGTNVAVSLFQTTATTGSGVTISAFRRIIVHSTTSADIVDTLDEDGAVSGDWVIIKHINSGGSHEISVKTETGPTEIAVLDATNGDTGFFYFDASAGRWRLLGLMHTDYAT
jgi:hypothetical protein